jgi:hypothetical protein
MEKVSNVYEINPPNLFQELAAKNDSIETIKFALPVNANINILEEANIETGDKVTIYSLTIKAKGQLTFPFNSPNLVFPRILYSPFIRRMNSLIVLLQNKIISLMFGLPGCIKVIC